jgi:hypothetical protein
MLVPFGIFLSSCPPIPLLSIRCGKMLGGQVELKIPNGTKKSRGQVEGKIANGTKGIKSIRLNGDLQAVVRETPSG